MIIMVSGNSDSESRETSRLGGHEVGRNVLTWLAVAGLVAASGPAGAQLAPGRSGFSSVTEMSGPEVWDAIWSFGRCFAREYRPDAFALLATRQGSPEERAVFERVFHGEVGCLGDVTYIRTGSRFLRGAIAEGLVRERTPLPPNLIVAAPADPSAVHSIFDAALCYVAGHRDEVQVLIDTTRPGSSGETAVIQRIGPDFLNCVPPAARSHVFNVTDLRFHLIEAFLRLPPAASAAHP
jgi:hypothetical protein